MQLKFNGYNSKGSYVILARNDLIIYYIQHRLNSCRYVTLLWLPVSGIYVVIYLQVFYSRLFKESGVDSLIICTYCPGHSALNFIEHAWAPITKKFASVKLTDKVPGESLPPHKQRGLTREEKTRKIDVVSDWTDHKHNIDKPGSLFVTV